MVLRLLPHASLSTHGSLFCGAIPTRPTRCAFCQQLLPDVLADGRRGRDAAPCRRRNRSTSPQASGALHAQLYKPDGNGPFPAVIALHGCGGLGGACGGRAAALSRLGGATAEGGQRGAAAGQLRLARTRPAMPRQGAPRAGAPRARRRHHRRAAMAGAAGLGGARPHQPDRLGQRRQRRAVGGASATAVARDRAGLPLGDRVLSGMPHLVAASAGARGCRRCC